MPVHQRLAVGRLGQGPVAWGPLAPHGAGSLLVCSWFEALASLQFVGITGLAAVSDSKADECHSGRAGVRCRGLFPDIARLRASGCIRLEAAEWWGDMATWHIRSVTLSCLVSGSQLAW